MKKAFVLVLSAVLFSLGSVAFAWQDTLPILLVTRNQEGKEVGSCGALPMEVTISSNRASMRVSISDNTSGGSGASIRASVWNAAITAAMLKNNPMNGARISVDFDGNVDGPSAGGMICLGILSALDGRQVPDDFAMTGTILPDGTIGLVGGVMHKIQAAASSGKIKRVAIPAFQRFEIDPNTKEYVDLFRLGEELGVVVKPVTSVEEVFRFCHGLPEKEEQILDSNVLCSLDRYTENALIGEFLARDKKIRDHLWNLNSNDFVEVSGSYAWSSINPIPSENLFEQGHLTEAFWGVNQCDAALRAYYMVKANVDDWLDGFVTSNRDLIVGLQKNDSAALSNSLDRLLTYGDDRCSSWLGFTSKDDKDKSSGPFTGFGKEFGPISPASAQMFSMMDIILQEGVYFYRLMTRPTIEGALSYLVDPENEASAISIMDDFVEVVKIDLFCSIWKQVRDEDISARIMKAMTQCELRKSGEEVARLFYNAWRSVDQEFSLQTIEPMAEGMSAHRNDAVARAISEDGHVARYERNKYWAEVLHAFVLDNKKTIHDHGFSSGVDIFRQVETFVQSSAMLLKYSDAGYDSQSGQYVNTAFLSYVIRIARSQALRSMAECRAAGIPYLSSIQYFERAETSRDNPGADRIHDVLENYWMANLRAKALLMAFEPTKK